MQIVRSFNRLAAGAALMAVSAFAVAQETEFHIAIKNHRFEPAQLEVPAGKKIRLVVDNQDPTPEEFESRSLRVEKVIPGNTKATVTVGPLKAGRYTFVGEFHESTAKGALVAR